MNVWIAAFGSAADWWGESIWRASWQGAIALTIAWAIARFCTFLSPRVVCWIWRLACIKLLVGLVVLPAVELPLLPAPAAVDVEDAPPAVRYDVARDWLTTYPGGAGAGEQPVEALPVSTIAIRLLLVGWLIGVGWCLARTARSWRAAGRLRAASEPCAAERLTAVLSDESRRLRVRRLPNLRLCRQIESPLLVGLWRPAILLPAGVAEKFDEAELRLMIAHELAHQKRHDLAWNWLPTVADWLFFFHPLVWVMKRRWLESQEAACDELVIQRQVARPADYGRLLVKLAASTSAEANLAPTAAGVLGVYRNLERRILAMARVKPFSARRLSVAFAVLALCALVAIVPWRLVAAEPKPVAEQPVFVYSATPIYLRTPEQPLADPAAARALQRLKELGAKPAGSYPDGVSIGIQEGWKGSDADLDLIEQLPNLNRLLVDLDFASAQAIEKLKFKRPLADITLGGLSDERLAALTHLPTCRELGLLKGTLSAAGFRRLASMAAGIEALEFFEPGSIDAGKLAAVGQIQSLKRLKLNDAQITDDGLGHLADLRQLDELGFSNCEGLGGPGYASLAGVKSLRQLSLIDLRIGAEGFRALAKIEQLEALKIRTVFSRPADLTPADVRALGSLSNLRSLEIDLLNVTGQRPSVMLGNAMLKTAGEMPVLRRLWIGDIPTSAGGLEALVVGQTEPAPEAEIRRPTLEELHLGNVAIDQRSLAALAKLTEFKKLERLELRGSGTLAVAELAELAKLTPLAELDLDNSDLDDAGLRQLTTLTSLEKLILSESNITGAGLESLANLKQLKELSLPNSPFDDEGGQALRAFPAIQWLELSRTKITDHSLEAIAALPELRAVSLNETHVTADGLMKLRELKHLAQLSVVGIKASADEMATLRAAMPDVVIVDKQPNWTPSVQPAAK